jgi:hypothetical protein
MHSWGVEGALRLFHQNISSVHRLGDSNPTTQGPIQLLNWNPQLRELTAAPFSFADASYVPMNRGGAAWQLGPGWSDAQAGRRAIDKRASARLYRPAGEAAFEWKACLGPESMREPGQVELRTFVDGQEMPKVFFDKPVCVDRRSPVRPRDAGIVGIDFLSSAPGQLAIGNFGFVSR